MLALKDRAIKRLFRNTNLVSQEFDFQFFLTIPHLLLTIPTAWLEGWLVAGACFEGPGEQGTRSGGSWGERCATRRSGDMAATEIQRLFFYSGKTLFTSKYFPPHLIVLYSLTDLKSKYHETAQVSLFHVFSSKFSGIWMIFPNGLIPSTNRILNFPSFSLKTKCFPQTENVQVVSFFPRPGSLSPCRLCSLLWHRRILARNHQPCHHKILLWLDKPLFFNDNDESSFTMKFTMTMMMVMMLLCPRWNTMWVSATRRTFGSANPTIGCLAGWEFTSSSSFSFETFKHQFLSYFVSSSILCTSQQWASNPQLTSQLHSLDDIWCNLN